MFIIFSIPFPSAVNPSTSIPTIRPYPDRLDWLCGEKTELFIQTYVSFVDDVLFTVFVQQKVLVCDLFCVYYTLHYTTLSLALVVRYGYVWPRLLREVYFIHWTFRKLALLPSSEFSAILYCLTKNTRPACLLLYLWRCLGSKRRYCEY